MSFKVRFDNFCVYEICGEVGRLEFRTKVGAGRQFSEILHTPLALQFGKDKPEWPPKDFVESPIAIPFLNLIVSDHYY